MGGQATSNDNVDPAPTANHPRPDRTRHKGAKKAGRAVGDAVPNLIGIIVLALTSL